MHIAISPWGAAPGLRYLGTPIALALGCLGLYLWIGSLELDFIEHRRINWDFISNALWQPCFDSSPYVVCASRGVGQHALRDPVSVSRLIAFGLASVPPRSRTGRNPG